MDYFDVSDVFEGPRDVVAGEAPESILSLLSQDQGEEIFASDIEEASSPPFGLDAFSGIDYNLPGDGDDDSSPAASISDFYEEIPFYAVDHVEPHPRGDVVAADVKAEYVYESDRTVYVDKVRRTSGSSNGVAVQSDDDDPPPPPPTAAVVVKEEEGGEPEVKKPRMSYAQLIAEALMNAEDRRLTLNEIYVHINARHPFYGLKGGKNWQNAIRHNLTLNRSFVKVPRPTNEGRGSFWQLEAGAEKAIFKRLLRQHYMSKVAGLEAMPPAKAKAAAAVLRRAAAVKPAKKAQFKIIKSIPFMTKPQKVTATVSSSSAAKPTIIYVTLPKQLVKW